MFKMWKKFGHNQQHSPVRQATCHKCQKNGHFQKICMYTDRVKKVETGEESYDHVFLGAVESSGKYWKVTLFLQFNGNRSFSYPAYL